MSLFLGEVGAVAHDEAGRPLEQADHGEIVWHRSGGSVSPDLPLIVDFIPLFLDFIPLFPGMRNLSSDGRNVKYLADGTLPEPGRISGFSL